VKRMRELAIAILAVGIVISGSKSVAGESVTVKPDCKVAPTKTVKQYITAFYMTTWGSAWAEGATQGFSEGLGRSNVADAIRRAMLRPQKTAETVFNELPTSLKPHCRVYATDRLAVAKAVASILPSLGNSILVSNVRAGIFKTDVIDREHIAAKWKDSYIITVTEEAESQVRVRVLRTVYISRDKGVTYNQAVPDGRNERWILTQIASQTQ
jgi:hypothetical protein